MTKVQCALLPSYLAWSFNPPEPRTTRGIAGTPNQHEPPARSDEFLL
jgi:hypothetical protein